MSLNLYRRHRSRCSAGHKISSQTGEYEETRKGWKKCACPIFASGALPGNPKFRKSTESSDWAEAKAVAKLFEDGTEPDPPPSPSPLRPSEPVPPPAAAPRITIEEAAKLYLEDYLRSGLSWSSHNKYRAFYKRFQIFMRDLGVIDLEDVTPAMMWRYRAASKLEPRNAANELTRLRTFFDFALAKERGWIKENPVIITKRRRTRASSGNSQQRIPFTDEQMTEMYAACKTYGKPRVYCETTRRWTGEDLEDFIAISVWTGLRISDVCTFHISRLDARGHIALRTTKGGGTVYTWVPKWLADRIRARARTVGPHIFGEHVTKNNEVITENWRRRLRELWSDMGKWDVTPTPHRFRHTFARILLQKHVPVSVVANLMGNTEKIVNRYYSCWVPERAEATVEIMEKCFADVPQPGTKKVAKVVKIRRQA